MNSRLQQTNVPLLSSPGEHPEDLTKRCCKCNQNKSVAEFYRRGSGLHSSCKTCFKQRSHVLYRRNAKHVVAQKRERRHGDWREWYEKQDGLCYLCQEPLPLDHSKFVMDHDHACCPGTRSCERCRRGLAHQACNRLLGHAGDDPEKLMRIASSFGKAQEETRRCIEANS